MANPPNDDLARKYTDDAMELMRYTDKREAIKVLTEGIDKVPNDVSLYLLRATCLADEGEYEDAVKDYDKAISLCDEKLILSKIYLSKALMKSMSKKFEGIDDDFKKAIELEPRSPIIIQAYGENLVRRKMGSQALPYLEKARKIFEKANETHMVSDTDELIARAKSQKKKR